MNLIGSSYRTLIEWFDRGKPACHKYTRHSQRFRQATDGDLTRREPCTYCYPDGEVDVAKDKRLIARSNPESIHRALGSGPVTTPESPTPGTTLASRLQDKTVTSVEDLATGGGV